MMIIFVMALPEEILLQIKYFFYQNQKCIIQIQPQNMVLPKIITYMTKPDEAAAVRMPMQWEPVDLIPQVNHIKNMMEIYGGGSARRVMIVMMRPR